MRPPTCATSPPCTCGVSNIFDPPSTGFNLFVIQRLTDKTILQIAWASFRFFLLLMLAVVILSLFPEIATWLPEQMTQHRE